LQEKIKKQLNIKKTILAIKMLLLTVVSRLSIFDKKIFSGQNKKI